MRRTTARLPSAALILATTRSSICHESMGTSLISFPNTVYPIFRTVNFSPSCDRTPTQLPFCISACFAAVGFGRFCLAGTGCDRAAAVPLRNNSNAMMVRLMLIPPSAMDVDRHFIESPQGGSQFYQPTELRLQDCC